MIMLGFEFEYLKLFHKRKISTSSFLAELLNVKVLELVLFLILIIPDK
jgi:hypothetical protein